MSKLNHGRSQRCSPIANYVGALLIVFSATSGAATEWVEVPGAVDGRRMFMDMASIVDVDGNRKAWIVSTWPENQSQSGMVYQSVSELHLYACGKRTFATKVMKLHSGPAGTGATVKEINIDATRLKWGEISPGTGLENLYLTACQK